MKEVERLDIVVKYSVTVAEGQLEDVLARLEAGPERAGVVMAGGRTEHADLLHAGELTCGVGGGRARCRMGSRCENLCFPHTPAGWQGRHGWTRLCQPVSDVGCLLEPLTDVFWKRVLDR